MWTCPCGVLNTRRRRSCSSCGARRERPTNAVVESNKTACPFVCPLCRGPLDWQGGCARCHGCTTGNKPDWTFPGDRYEPDPDNPGHYTLTDLRAGRPSCTPRENIAAMQIVQVVLAKHMTVQEAEGHLAVIFQGRERLDRPHPEGLGSPSARATQEGAARGARA
jgi:hypothetical protein